MNAVRNVCGVVVTYFPPAGLEGRLCAIARHVDRLVIVDNSATTDIRVRLDAIAQNIGAELICNAQNAGVATALNQGVAAARGTQADWVALFDQDSEPVAQFRAEIEKVMDLYHGEQPLAIIGCNYFLADAAKPAYPSEVSGGENYLATDHVITSGSFYDMRIMAALGPFRDDFFIDAVDIEYCWRAMSRGYAVCRTAMPLLRHALGTPAIHAAFGRSWTTSNHAAFRRYYMVRNSTLLIREYGTRFPRLALGMLRIQLKWFVTMLVFERGRGVKLAAVARGIWHGLLKRTDCRPAAR